jgi:hypothetical protein
VSREQLAAHTERHIREHAREVLQQVRLRDGNGAAHCIFDTGRFYDGQDTPDREAVVVAAQHRLQAGFLDEVAPANAVNRRVDEGILAVLLLRHLTIFAQDTQAELNPLTRLPSLRTQVGRDMSFAVRFVSVREELDHPVAAANAEVSRGDELAEAHAFEQREVDHLEVVRRGGGLCQATRRRLRQGLVVGRRSRGVSHGER